MTAPSVRQPSLRLATSPDRPPRRAAPHSSESDHSRATACRRPRGCGRSAWGCPGWRRTRPARRSCHRGDRGWPRPDSDGRRPRPSARTPTQALGDLGCGGAVLAETEVGPHPARVHGDRPSTAGPQPSIELEGEQQVGQLALPVRAEGPIAPAFPLRVGEIQVGPAVRVGGDRHDPVGDLRQQQRGQQEVAEVVGPELQLEAVGGLGPLRVAITPALLIRTSTGSVQAGREPAYRREVREVEGAAPRRGSRLDPARGPRRPRSPSPGCAPPA